jgi:hypothetical protein
MVKSCDGLIMEITKEPGLNHMAEDAEDEEDDEDADFKGDATAPLAPAPPPAAAPEEIVEVEDPMEIVPEKEAPVVHEVILADVEPELSQPRLYHTLMRVLRRARPGWWMTRMIQMMTRMKPALTWMNGFLRMVAMIRIESSSLSLKFRF